MNDRHEHDPEFLFQVFWGVVQAIGRAIAGVAISIAFGPFLMSLILQPMESLLGREPFQHVLDESRKIFPVLCACVGACLITETIRSRLYRIIIGTFLGLVAGRFFMSLLTEAGYEVLDNFTLITTLVSGSLGAWIANGFFQRSQPDSEVLSSEPNPETSPLWDRELDGCDHLRSGS